MSNLVDANGRRINTLITPEQNLALHQQNRQLIQNVVQDFRILSYRQALLLEYVINQLNVNIDGFEEWAKIRDEEVRAEIAEAQLEAEAKATQEAQSTVAGLLAGGTPIQLED